MRIWHEKLLPKLCRPHILACWREALGAYEIISKNKSGYRNHPATKEFEKALPALWNRLYWIRHEMLNRGYKPKELPPKPKDVLPNVVNEWQSLEHQVEILRSKGCKCDV